MRWRAWYSDGSVYDSSRHRSTDLPLDGALIFMLWARAAGRQIMQGTEWYFVAPGDVWGQAMGIDYPPGDPASVIKGIQTRYPGARVMRGKDVSAAAYITKQEDASASGRPSG